MTQDTQDIEQYRSGFEAWALGKGLPRGRYPTRTEYLNAHTEFAWQAWSDSKREASTEPSADQALSLVQELSRISMSLAADLVKGADITVNGQDFLARMFVVDRVVQWRNEWDATAEARAELAARFRAAGRNTCNQLSGISGESGGAQKDEATDAALSPELREVLSFLMGEAPLGGVWFGDRHPESKTWWWRTNLRAAIAAHTKAQEGK